MPYDANGNWTSQVTPDAQGFVNFVSPATPNSTGPLTASKAAPLIQKQVG